MLPILLIDTFGREDGLNSKKPMFMPFCDDGTMSDNDIMRKYYEECQRSMALFGYDIELGTRVGDFLERAGFDRVTSIKRKTPLGTWARDKTMRVIGLYTREAVLNSVDSVIGKPFAALGFSEVDREVWAAKVTASAKEDHVHQYYNFYFWYAQKPEC